MAPTSVSLLERLRNQPDSESWNHFVQLYTPFIHGWLGRQRWPGVEVEDLVQEVLTVVLRELPRFRHDGRPGAFRRWLRLVTVNRLRTWWRKWCKQPHASGDNDFLQVLDQLEDPASLLSRRWDQEHDHYLACRVLELVEGDFDPTTWRAFQRLALEEVRAAAVAQELGMSVNAVLLAKSRVLRRLRQEMEGLKD